MLSVPGRFFVYSSVYRGVMASTMVKARGFGSFVTGMPAEGLGLVHKGKWVDVLLSERRLVAVGRAAFGSRCCNAGGESVVKRWDVDSGGKGFGRSSFWSHYGAGGSLTRGVSTSRIVAKSLDVSAGAGEVVDESVSLVDQVEFCVDRLGGNGAAVLEVASGEAGGSGGDGLSVGREADAVVAEVDLAGNA